MKQEIIDTLKDYRYIIALISVFNFLLTPIHIAVSGFNPAYVVVVNFTLVILGSSLIAFAKTAKVVTYILGAMTLVFIWMEFSDGDSKPLMLTRLLVSLALFITFCVLLLKELKKIKKINLQFILLPILGFLYLGIIGGILFEVMHLADSKS
ncbi:MAG: hypothetical protein ACR2MT_08470, partial [Aurantibacter sp.]